VNVVSYAIIFHESDNNRIGIIKVVPAVYLLKLFRDDVSSLDVIERHVLPESLLLELLPIVALE
jgi:hypothetical protein